MGTLSKRPLRQFGVDVKERVEHFRSNVGGKLGHMKECAETESMHEGVVTKGIEKLTASLPSTTWLLLAGVSLVGSFALKVTGRNHASIFVGQWVPTFLMLGVYNKLVKVVGSERATS